MESSELVKVTQQDQKYLGVRQKAYEIGEDLEQAELEYRKEAIRLIKNLQQKFYKSYGSKIHELEDLQDAINQYQSRGLKQLKRKLQQIYLEEVSDQPDTDMLTDKSIVISKSLQEKAKKLYEEYRSEYCPPDKYQEKVDREAKKLQKSIMGDKNHQVLYI